MWNAVVRQKSRDILQKEAIETLEYAVQNCIEHDVRSGDVYDALDLLQSYTPNRWGFTLFREGLEQFDWNIRAQYLSEALVFIKKHICYEG